MSFDRGLRNLSESFPVTEIFGLSLTYVNNRVRYKRTLASNLIKAPRAARSLKALSHLVDENKIDLVITDFEPLSCHIGHRKRLPVIAIDNQHTITNAIVTLPRGFRRDVAAIRLVTRMMTPHADAYLALSFFSAPVKKRNTFLFPPILRHEVLSATPQTGDYVLVYDVAGKRTSCAAQAGPLQIRSLWVRNRRPGRQHLVQEAKHGWLSA